MLFYNDKFFLKLFSSFIYKLNRIKKGKYFISFPCNTLL